MRSAAAVTPKDTPLLSKAQVAPAAADLLIDAELGGLVDTTLTPNAPRMRRQRR
jgi:hypothetical protein